jgi:hypothetical protein
MTIHFCVNVNYVLNLLTNSLTFTQQYFSLQDICIFFVLYIEELRLHHIFDETGMEADSTGVRLGMFSMLADSL